MNYLNEAAPESMGMLMTEEELAHENNPLGLPEGFFKVMSAIGKRVLGTGFYCPKCKLHVPLLGKKHQVKHCGRVEAMPRGWFAGWPETRHVQIAAHTASGRNSNAELNNGLHYSCRNTSGGAAWCWRRSGQTVL